LRALSVVALAFAAVAALTGITGCSTQKVDGNRAVQIARDLVSTSQDSGAHVTSLSNQEPSLRDGKWTVAIDATVLVDTASGQKAVFHYIVEVEQAGGAARIVAQG